MRQGNLESVHEIFAAEWERGTREDLQRGYGTVTPNYATTHSGLAKEVQPGLQADTGAEDRDDEQQHRCRGEAEHQDEGGRTSTPCQP
jgi:hypothetical protein